MTTLTLVSIVVMLYGILGSHGYGRALAIGGGTPAGAALVAGGSTAVPTFYFAALGAAAGLVLAMFVGNRSRADARQALPPGARLMLALFLWVTLVTLAAPELFDGLTVLSPGPTPNRLTAGLVSSPNIAQVIYLLLGLMLVVFLARSEFTGPELIGLATGITTILSMWRYLHVELGLPFPVGIFDNSPSFVFIDTAPGGAARFRGILSEPAGLATSCVVAMSYMLPRSFQVTGWRRVGTLLIAGSAAYMGFISTSTTFVVAGGVVAALAVLTFGFGFLSRRTSVSVLLSVGACVVGVAAIWFVPSIVSFFVSSVDTKVSSQSFDARSGTDATSYDLVFDTYGFGVGVGANRSSSFLPGLLSTTGVPGTVMFLLLVFGLIRQTARIRACRPVIWALVALLVVKFVSSPDLSDTSGVLYISLGILSNAILKSKAQNSVVSPLQPTVPAPDVDERPAQL